MSLLDDLLARWTREAAERAEREQAELAEEEREQALAELREADNEDQPVPWRQR